MPKLASLQRVAGRRYPQRARARGFALVGLSLLLSAALASLGPHLGAFVGRPGASNVVLPPLPAGSLSTSSTATSNVMGFVLDAAPSVSASATGTAALAATFLASAAIITSRMVGAHRLMIGASRLVVRRAEGEQSGEPIPLEKLKVGDKFDATVVRIGKIGIWVSIGAQKDALWPLASIPKGAKYKAGDKIPEMIIREVQTGEEAKNRKIYVGIETGVQPADVGKVFEATVTRSTTFGVFFDIGAAADALAQKAQLAKNTSDYKAGDKVKVKLVSQTESQSRVTDILFDTLSYEDLEVGQEVEGVVGSINEQFGIFVKIGLPRDALYRINQLEKPLSEYKMGEKLTGLRVAAVDASKSQVEVTTRGLAFEVKVGDELEGTVAAIDEKFGVFFDAGLWSDVLAPNRMLSKPCSEFMKGTLADLTVVSVDAKTQRITVTDKPSDQLGTPLGNLVRGSTVTGTVTGVSGEGVYVDIGAMKEALLPNRFLSKPRQEYQKGDQLEGLIISKIDTVSARLEVVTPMGAEKETVGLEGFEVGSKVEGVVTRVMPFGTFVDIGGPRDAMLQGENQYKVGDKLPDLRITVSDPEGNKLGVTTRKLASDFSVGEKIEEGTIKNCANFGVFVDIGASMEALIPRSRLAKDLAEYSKGMKLTDLTVLTVDTQENKISVGEVADTSADGGLTLESLKVGEKVTGTVKAQMDYGVFVDIGLPRRDALLPKSQMPKDAPEMKPGEEIEVYIMAVDPANQKVSLSLTEPSKQAASQFVSSDDIPIGDMLPDPKVWLRHFPAFKKGWLTKEPMDVDEWAEKFPGMFYPAKWESEVYFFAIAESFPGITFTQQAKSYYLPVPLRLRREDAGPPEIPPMTTDDNKIDYDVGLKPEIYVKYRKPPFNDPNWTYRLPPREQKKYAGMKPMDALKAREKEEEKAFERMEKEQEEAQRGSA